MIYRLEAGFNRKKTYGFEFVGFAAIGVRMPCGAYAGGTPALLVAVEEVFHEVVALLDVEVGLFGGGFGVGELDILAGGHAGDGDGEGDGFVVVLAGHALGGV